jgi:hypothetical protein
MHVSSVQEEGYFGKGRTDDRSLEIQSVEKVGMYKREGREMCWQEECSKASVSKVN